MGRNGTTLAPVFCTGAHKVVSRRARPSQLPGPPVGNLEVVEAALPDYAVIVFDRHGKIVEWNAVAERIFGHKESEVKGKSIDLLFSPEDRAGHAGKDEMRRASRGGMVEDQRWYLKKDGSRIWVSGTLRALRNERGQLEGFSKIVRDMTSHKLEESRLLDRERSARVWAESRWRGLEEIFENVPAMIGLLRLPEQAYVFANQLLRALSPIELIGRTIREAHPKVSPVVFDIVDRVAATGRAYTAKQWQVPLLSMHETTERPYLDVVIQPMRSEAGHFEAILMFASDVTTLVRARQEAERLTAKLRMKRQRLEKEIAERKRAENLAKEQAALLDLAPDCIVSLALDGTILFWNCGAEQEYGWSKKEALGRNMHELLRTELPAPREKIMEDLLAHGQWSGEVKHTTKDGRVIEDLSRWVVRAENGVPYGLLEIDRDITDRKRVEVRLRENQKLESLGIFAGGMAHDFNNLLTGMIGNISLARHTAEPESSVHELLARAEEAGGRAADLIKQMLAFTGKGQLVVEAVDLSQVVRDAGSLLPGSFGDEIRMTLELGDQLPAVRADPTQLRQVALNLILNAAEAVAGKPVKVVVRTGVREVDPSAAEEPYDIGRPDLGPSVILQVEDNGAGIDPAIRAKIFDPFFTTKFTGRGLGLAAVAGIVRMLNGAIRVDSTPGVGTTVTVLLPAEKS
jgi:PAS domain S-box-containing protein